MGGFGPETRALLEAFNANLKELQAIKNAVAGYEEPSQFVAKGQYYHQQDVLDKDAAFANQEVEAKGYTKIHISTNGNLDGITYNVWSVGGTGWGPDIQAFVNPVIVGHIQKLRITNVQPEPNHYVYIDKFIAPWIMLPAMQHGTANSVGLTKLPFRMLRLQEVAAADTFNVSLTRIQPPTELLNTEIQPTSINMGKILRIHYRINPTNAVTYTLRIWRGTVDGGVTPYLENVYMLWQSDPLQADDEEYDRNDIEIPFWLFAANSMYYSLEWTGATGNVQGFVEVSGEKY